MNEIKANDLVLYIAGGRKYYAKVKEVLTVKNSCKENREGSNKYELIDVNLNNENYYATDEQIIDVYKHINS